MNGNHHNADQKYSDTIRYYDDNAEAFVEQTRNADLSELHQTFLSTLPNPARILDAGSGSGRDSLAFKTLGHDVVAIDASAEMVKSTRMIAGVPAVHSEFLQYQSDHLFDGIWACASLLHVEKLELPETLSHLAKLMNDDGIMFVSFKSGFSEQMRNGRFFRDMSEKLFDEILRDVPELRLSQTWETCDVRPNRDEKWLNYILCRG